MSRLLVEMAVVGLCAWCGEIGDESTHPHCIRQREESDAEKEMFAPRKLSPPMKRAPTEAQRTQREDATPHWRGGER